MTGTCYRRSFLPKQRAETGIKVDIIFRCPLAQGIISLPKKIKSDVHEDQGRNCSFLRRCSAVHGVGGLDGVRASNNDGSYRQLQVYSEVLSRVRSEYVEEPNIPAVTDGALHGLLESLDSNSSYLTRRRVQGIQVQSDRGQRRDRSGGFQALWLCRGHLGHSRRSGRQGRHSGQRYFRSHRRQEHARNVARRNPQSAAGAAGIEPERSSGPCPPRRAAEDRDHARYRHRAAGHRQDG